MEHYKLEPKREHRFNEDAYIRAQKRLKELKGFYWHLFWYLAVNLFITISKIVNNLSNGETLNDAFFDFGTFAVWLFWGIGLLGHFVGVFGKNWIFSKEWEERKVQEFIEKEQSRS